MAALTKSRDTRRRGPNIDMILASPVAADAVIFRGALVAYDSDGYLVPASVSPLLTVIGRADDEVDNTNGLDGAKSCNVRTNCVFAYANDGLDAIDQSHVGQLCYATDDQTVAATTGGDTKSAAGFVTGLAASGEIWVLCLPHKIG